MKELAIRLTGGSDLKKSISELALKHHIDTAIILSAVGCLQAAHIRLAGAKDSLLAYEDYEILSLQGTISKGKCHLHICLADKEGAAIGGHLLDGCIINTTCELVIGVMEDYQSFRTYDEQTGYEEIVFKELKC